MKVTFLWSLPGTLGYLRQVFPAQVLKHAGYEVRVVSPGSWKFSGEEDVVVLSLGASSGSDAMLGDLVESLHVRGVRVVLDVGSGCTPISEFVEKWGEFVAVFIVEDIGTKSILEGLVRKPIVIIPSCADRSARFGRRSSAKSTIGWVMDEAGRDFGTFLCPILGRFLEGGRSRKLVVYGDVSSEVKVLRGSFLKQVVVVPMKTGAPFWELMDVTAGVIPPGWLPGVPGSVQWAEYVMSGAVSIATSLSGCGKLPPGSVYVANSVSEWESALVRSVGFESSAVFKCSVEWIRSRCSSDVVLSAWGRVFGVIECTRS